MAMVLPDKITENNLDDIQSVDFDIDSLYDKFIAPIEAMRSISAPVILQLPRGIDADGQAIQRELDTANVDNTAPQESRAHAFYRCIGLPVIDQDFNIYNPGYNPKRTEKAKRQNNSIADRISLPIRMMSQLRETTVRNKLPIFQRRGLDSSIYALALPIAKNFQNMDTNKDFTTQDNQQFTIARRKNFLSANYTESNGSELKKFFESGSHILRPFVCDAAIERTVMPASRMVCEPFLANLNETVLELNVLLPRPKIEQVLRLRLRQNSDQIAELDESVFLLDPNMNTSGISLPDLRRIAFALLNDNKINDSDLLNKIGATNTELVFLNNLIKTIKAVIDLLLEAIETISNITKNIDWTPLPSILGPQFGSDVGSFVSKTTKSSELERRILELSLKAQNSQRQFTTSTSNIGNFALSSFDNMEKLFIDELFTAKEQKLEFIRRGSEALKTIEIITGEISGLGLIDILAVYTALWSVDLDTLLSLLDVNAFQRLYDNNSDLRNSNVVARNNGGAAMNGFDAVNSLERQIINILAFADGLVEQGLSSPKLAEGGSI